MLNLIFGQFNLMSHVLTRSFYFIKIFNIPFYVSAFSYCSKKNFFVFENANETLKDAEHKNVSVEIYRGQPGYLY